MAFNWPADDLTVKEKIGVGTDTPTEKLEVKGNLKLNVGVAVGEFSSDGTFATANQQSVATTQATKTYVTAQVTALTATLTTKAEKGGALTQDFQANNLTVQGNLEVTGQTTFRNIEQHQGDLELGNQDTDQVRIHGIVQSTHSSNTLQVASPINVGGSVTATAFLGNGAGLTGLPMQWATNGSDIAYTSGNVGIGTASPHTQLTLTGSLGFTNATTPLMYVFQSGWANPERPIISHSPPFPNWGLSYRDADDAMIFQSGGTPVMTVNLSGQSVQVARGLTVGSVVMPTEVGRIVASGPVGEVAFVDRRLSTWPSTAQAGDRFLWYTADRVARLWTERLGDVLSVDSTGILRARGFVTAPSSRELKENMTALSSHEAVETLAGLQPIKFNYKADHTHECHVGFIAEEVPDLVAQVDRKSLNAMDIVAVLTKVLQEQQQTIATLTDRLNALEAKQA